MHLHDRWFFKNAVPPLPGDDKTYPFKRMHRKNGIPGTKTRNYKNYHKSLQGRNVFLLPTKAGSMQLSSCAYGIAHDNQYASYYTDVNDTHTDESRHTPSAIGCVPEWTRRQRPNAHLLVEHISTGIVIHHGPESVHRVQPEPPRNTLQKIST